MDFLDLWAFLVDGIILSRFNNIDRGEKFWQNFNVLVKIQRFGRGSMLFGRDRARAGKS